jgi:Zn-dependent oligopeptidase
MKDIKAALTAADAQYRTASSAYTSASSSGLGIPKEVQDAYDAASARLSTVQGAYDRLSSPATQAAIKAQNLKRINGVPATPVNTGGAMAGWNPTASDGIQHHDSRGNPISVVNGRWVQSNGQAPQ